MSSPVVIIWRILLVGLFLAVSVLLNFAWVEVELSLVMRQTEEPQTLKPFQQTGFNVARGEVQGGMGRGLVILMGLIPEIAEQFRNLKIGGSWLLSLYGPALLAGIVLSLIVGPNRIGARILLAVVGLALGVLAYQLLGGLPLAEHVAGFNAACQGNVRFAAEDSLFQGPPEMRVHWGTAPAWSVVLLVMTGLVASLGIIWPKVENKPHEFAPESSGTPGTERPRPESESANPGASDATGAGVGSTPADHAG